MRRRNAPPTRLGEFAYNLEAEIKKALAHYGRSLAAWTFGEAKALRDRLHTLQAPDIRRGISVVRKDDNRGAVLASIRGDVKGE